MRTPRSPRRSATAASGVRDAFFVSGFTPSAKGSLAMPVRSRETRVTVRRLPRPGRVTVRGGLMEYNPRARGGKGLMYVDHAATTPVRPEVLAAILPYFPDEWGNPSSVYGPGRRAAQAITRARDTLADILDCAREEIVFTGSG